MIVKLGFLVTASVAVYAVKQISIKSLRPLDSTRKFSENGEISSKQDENEKGDKGHFIDFSSTTAEEDGEKVTGIRNARSLNSKNHSAFDDEKESILPEFRYHYPTKVEQLLWDEKFDATSNFEAKRDSSVYKTSQDDHVTEPVQLQNQIKELEGSKVKLERKLLESYKLKEQESELDELQRHLKITTAEIEMMHFNIKSLQEERKKLQKEIENGVSAMKQLEMAKRKIRKLQSQIEIGSNQMKDQVLMLEQHITSFQSETVTKRDTKADKNVKVLKMLELKILKLKRENKELQLEKRELTLKLIAAKSKITAFSNVTESEVVSEMEEEVNNLKIDNEELSKQIERIQKSNFSVVEELVYQRWVKACLRHEIQSHQRFSINLSPKTRENFKKKLVEYATMDSGQGDVDLNRISSQAPSNESEEFDDITTETTTRRPTGTSNKHNLFQKIKRWVKRWGGSKNDSSTVSLSGSYFEGSSSSRTSLNHRPLTSMHPSEAFMPNNADDSSITSIVKEQDSAESQETPKLRRKRRVSFNESVDNAEASVEKISKSVEGVLVDNKQPVKDCYKLALEGENSIEEDIKQSSENKLEGSLDMNLNSGSQAEEKRTEQICGSGNSIEQHSDSLMVDKKVNANMKADHSEMLDQRRSPLPSKSHNKIDTQELHFVNIFYFLLLILFVILLLKVVGVF
ncbi:protein CHUP1, chloroplastic-like [Macadamia integrifolia]|uniref:protein CHUP1, chloroplastic-like n=1 Tax=Macadamia integrifolia TaxID=60698 RepID=UPI001C4EAFDC|nr:protein CHUP1, chloroplastic-like [Macadamia integrifolia]